MTDYYELNIEALGKTLRERASGMRRLASQILDGEFRIKLIALALHYDLQAEALERGTRPHDG
jgi:hypothetical protein